MAVELILVPYVLGREGVGMGAGPLALREVAEEVLRPAVVTRVALSAPFENEVGACFDLNRQVAAEVAAAAARGSLPVVMTGNCHTQQAVAAGLGGGADGLGLVWFDCHADFHTPGTTTSGFFDGQALSMTVGHCWEALCATVPGFAPVAEERVVLVGARDVDEGEEARLAASGIVRAAATAHAPAERVSLHLDLDVLDPDTVGRANAWATAGGLSAEALAAAVRGVGGIAAVTISAYDPAHDDTGGVRDALRRVLRELAA